jgi:hypothetical protein
MQQQNITIYRTYKPIMTLEHPYLYILEMDDGLDQDTYQDNIETMIYTGYKVVLGTAWSQPYVTNQSKI